MQMLKLYLIIINVITFFVFLSDKWAAQRGQSRVPESTLVGLQFLGGVYGALLVMYFCWHKVRKVKFVVFSFVSFVLVSGIIYRIMFF